VIDRSGPGIQERITRVRVERHATAPLTSSENTLSREDKRPELFRGGMVHAQDVVFVFEPAKLVTTATKSSPRVKKTCPLRSMILVGTGMGHRDGFANFSAAVGGEMPRYRGQTPKSVSLEPNLFARVR
jgi:hypothetical protein